MSRKLVVPNLDDLIRRYNAGASLKQLADELGVSRGGLKSRSGKPWGLTGVLAAAGVKLRGQSDAERVKWSQMAPDQRAAQVAHAHATRRGQVDSDATRIARSLDNYRTLDKMGANELELALALDARGIYSVQQRPMDGYNIDLAIEESRIAVELYCMSWPSSNYPGELLQRTKHILNQGWVVLFVLGRPFDESYVADHVIALMDRVGRDESLRGHYGVIGGNPKRRPRSTAKLDGLPRIPCPEPTAKAA
jgi:very-short-patch-repair endonuclease